MNTKMLDLLKNRNYSFPKYLIKLYKKLGLDESLLLVVIFLLNLDDPITCDYKMFAEERKYDIVIRLWAYYAFGCIERNKDKEWEGYSACLFLCLFFSASYRA